MYRLDKTDCFFGGMVIGILLVWVIGILLVWGAFEIFDKRIVQLQQQAIAHGYADYLVDTNKTVTFQWKK
jgi:hypothetical protein